MDDDNKLEQELKDLGLTAPRLNPELIAEQVVSEQYYVFPGTVLTVCCLTLRNGYNVVGTSAPASPENFNEKVGRDLSRKKAVEQIWALEGYVLKSKLNQTL